MSAFNKLQKFKVCDKDLNIFCNKIEKANTSNQIKTVLATAGMAVSGRKLQGRISCQPTSVARRKSASKGRAPVLRGKVVKKRAHSLALSVRSNKPHAKRH